MSTKENSDNQWTVQLTNSQSAWFADQTKPSESQKTSFALSQPSLMHLTVSQEWESWNSFSFGPGVSNLVFLAVVVAAIF
jgi:hypothetical protein